MTDDLRLDRLTRVRLNLILLAEDYAKRGKHREVRRILRHCDLIAPRPAVRLPRGVAKEW